VMKVLTLITIVMAIPSLVSGLWGMNVPVPFSADPYGFYIVVAFVLVLVVASFVAFWKKRLF
ncbi:MAG TPA: CorA family divalent cation transporter, partial [Synergistaceae bacterium]|nr:CorA family divalent cation transporter [Synergistaceae bacterium]